ncbi:MAG: SAM-dependent methyltransferase [Acidobacteriia bacterium]|nr:SAM-dependent methyltransferase [Terriglobia bacterium]
MQDQQASRTAQYMAFFRALEMTEPRAQRLFSDPYAFPLLSGALRIFARLAHFPVVGRAIRTILDLGWPYTRSSGVVRTRAIDDLVNEAIRDGARQFVLLGAGFDSRPYRLQEVTKVAVFEVDHPATQRAKQERLSCVVGARPANVQFVSVNFEQDDLESSLLGAGFHPENPAVVVWEGVISYLTKSAVDHTFALLHKLLAPGSRLIFTYVDRAALDGTKKFAGGKRWKSSVRFSGEPFIFGFHPDGLAATLRDFGFSLTSDESTEQIAIHYRESMGRKEPGSQAYRVAAAVRTKI